MINFLDRKSGRYTGGKRRRVSLTRYQQLDQEEQLESLMTRTVVSMVNGDPNQLSVYIYRDPVPDANLGKPGVGSLVSICPNTSTVSPLASVNNITISSTQNSQKQ